MFKKGDKVRVKHSNYWIAGTGMKIGDDFVVSDVDENGDIYIEGKNLRHFAPCFELIEGFVELEEVEVSDGDIWKKRIYLCTIPGNTKYKYVCVDGCDKEKYNAGEMFAITRWAQIRKLKKEVLPEYTQEEVEKELGRKFKLITN